MSPHETLQSTDEVVRGSDRSFGLVFAVVFAIIGFWPTLWRGEIPRLWALGIALIFLGAAYLVPHVLSPLNKLWYRFGLLLHHIVNPIVMGLVYFISIVPTSLVLKVLGKDLLRLKRDDAASTYWITREPPGPAQNSMQKQF